MDPTHHFSHATSTGTQQYNATRTNPSTNWPSYVKENYHAARKVSGLDHQNTMKSLGTNYREKRS
jgi:hypothetical protein